MATDAMGPAVAVRKHVGVSKQLFYYWVREGKLKPAATDSAGRPLYRYRDVAVVDSQSRNSPRSSRNPLRRIVAA